MREAGHIVFPGNDLRETFLRKYIPSVTHLPQVHYPRFSVWSKMYPNRNVTSVPRKWVLTGDTNT